MIKDFTKLVMKSLILLGLLVLVLRLLEPLFTESPTSVWTKFYDQETDSVNILILGNSHANAGIDGDILSAKLNSNVISLATRGQNIYQSYYCALEAYKYQTPEVLIIENFLFYERLTMDAFVHQDPTINDYMKRYLTFEGKKFDDVKIEESKAFFNGNIITNMFPTLKKHHRWTDIDNIKKRLHTIDKKSRQKGTTVLSLKSVENYKTKTEFDLSKYNILPEEEKALKDIVDLAKEKGTKQIILLTVPFYKGYRNKIDYKSLDNPLTKFSGENEGVTYMDLNRNFFNWDHTFFSNDPVGYNQHLNYKGAIAVSNHLVSVIGQTNNFEKNINYTPEYYLYNKVIKEFTTDKKPLIGNLETINGSKDVQYTINQGYLPVVITGWMAIENEISEDQELFIGLLKDENFVYISSSSELKTKVRKDVTKYFDKEDGMYDNSGFQVKINSNLLEKGQYSLYIILKKNNDITLKNTYKTVEIK